MRVVVVLNGPANDAERSILERREVALLRQLHEQGVDVTVALCGDEGGLAADLRHSDTPVTVIPIALPPNAAGLSRIPAAALRLRALIRLARPDLVEGTEPIPAIAAALAAQRTTMIYRRQHGTGGRLRLTLASWLAAKLADRTIVSCDAIRQQALTDDRTDLDRIEIATPGTAEPRVLSAAERTAIRQSIGLHEDVKVIAVISRFRREKGLDTLLRATRRLNDVHRGIHLIVAGTGPEESNLRALAAQSPHAIDFLGHRNDIASLMQIADVVAIPSRRESFGRVVLEAMANGRPVVATRAGGLAEAVVDGETGFLVPIDDEPALAAALQRLLSDDALAETFGHAARERYRSRYTIAHMATARRTAWERSLT